MLNSHHLFLVLCCFVVTPILADDSLPGTEVQPHWIWSVVDRSPNESARFSKSFTIDESVIAATLSCVGESTGLTLAVDGETIATLEPYDPLFSIDIAERLRSGTHEVAVVAKPVDGPSAFFLQLEIEFDGGLKRSIVSDTSWSTTMNNHQAMAVSFGHVDPSLTIPKSRRVGISAIDNYEQWKQALGTNQGTDPASFVVTPGFEIQLVRSAQSGEDSWVSMEFDPQGRLLIAKETQGLLRMTLSEDGSEVTGTELIDDTLKECRGLVFSNGDLFANANNSKGLYRLRKIDDDRFEKPELVYASSGGVGHGRNDLALGPDGMIYSIHGDSVDLPDDAIDYTSPFRDARRGKRTSEGHLLRIDPATGKVEVLAAGLRNPFGIDFNPDGDIFTYDADAEHDMGSPWYRPTRVSHLITGGDYGWRGVTKSWPSYYPDHTDNARPNLDIGKGSPTAVKFGTHSNFPLPYRDALFILDWAYGRIIAVHCLPRGSSYLLTAETFLKGRPLNVTDLGFSPEGSMYLVTGGRMTKSALYRVRYTGGEVKQVLDVTPQQLACATFVAESRNLRHELEAELQNKGRSDRIDWVWSQLSDADPWIGQAAIHLLEQYPIAMWQERSLREPTTQPALKSLLSLARSAEQDLFPAIIRRLNEVPIDSAPRSLKLVSLQSYSLCLVPEIIESQTQHDLLTVTRQKLDAMYPDESYLVNQLLSDLLVRIQSPDVITKSIRLLNVSTDQAEQMHYLYVLRNVQEGWTIADRTSYFTALTQTKDYLAGAGMTEFITKIHEEAVATLSDAERQALGSLVEVPREDLDSDGPNENAKPRPYVQKWLVDGVLASRSNDVPRDIERGREMFAAATCVRCHRIAGRGTLVGPDLTAASRRFNRRDLLTSIIEPSKVIAENYRSLQIVTRDGNAYVGQTVLGGDYRSSQLRLATDPADPFKTIEIAKSEIEIQTTSPVSWMPEGLLDTLTRDEILDLIAYIESAESIAP